VAFLPASGSGVRSCSGAKGAAASLTLALAIGGTGSAQQPATTDLAAALLAPIRSGPASPEPGELPAPWRRTWRARESPPQQEVQEAERWSSFLPLMKEEALARGYQLPLPFGAGVTATILTGRDIEVDDLRIGVDGEEPTSVSQFVDLGSESDVFNANLKLDAWILPFLNVYALLGYVYNESKTNLHVTLPGREFDMDVDTDLDGFVGGGGLTLAAGYGEFFMVIDSNYSRTDIGFDDSFRAVTASMRAGVQATLGQKPCQIWLGGAYWDTANVAKGTTDVPGVGRVDFEADQGPVYPWLVDFGGNLRIAPGFEFFVDLAFDLHGGAIFTIGPVFRF
jgi:hypothetical protein